ncbi:MAG: [FeFe] hydrogenase H-cluster maturation GTPase HydF [Spirochaetes bacterium]|nr:[FeFe] hydrogenase H-cluster maturation GTPase HydF [Spirochaetota bacterium]
MQDKTIRGDRLHIAFFGRRNAGKSSLINALTGQTVSIVSKTPGTTTDPVFKAMELSSIGPVVMIDTAGIDDTKDELGSERIKASEKILGRTDFAILVADLTSQDFSYENDLLALFDKRNIPYIITLNKTDLEMSEEAEEWIKEKAFVRVSARLEKGIAELKKRILEKAPSDWEPPFLSDLIKPMDIVLLVTPVDLGAPKGRLIMPQIKALRDILDADAIPMMCKERELLTALSSLKEKPALAVTDSQVFPQVNADLPGDIPLTSFSILSIRQKGNLKQMIEGLSVIKALKPGDKILIAESCTHHPLEDDIGRIKIPRWLNNFVGGGLDIKSVPGYEYPDNLNDYKLVVHCGACTLNRIEMLRRQEIPEKEGVAMTNYGVLISFLKGIFPKAIEPFPEMADFIHKKKSSKDISIIKRMASLAEI